MYAIVDVAGQQFKVEEGKKIFVHRLREDLGETIEIDQVLLIDLDGKVIVGEPLIKGALVTAKVLEHMRGDKVKVFKKKRRKGYQKLSGHRQDLTHIQIESISEKGEAKKKPVAKTAAKSETKKTDEVKKVAEKKPAAKTDEKKPTPKTAKKKPVAKAAEKKPATKSTTASKKVAEKKPAAKPAAKKAAASKKEGEKKVVKKAPVKKAAAKTTKKSGDKK